MVVYHVTCLKKLNKYIKSCQINAPVKAWETIEEAEGMSLSTGRRIILRLKFPDNCEKLSGHFNKARVLKTPYKINNNNY